MTRKTKPTACLTTWQVKHPELTPLCMTTHDQEERPGKHRVALGVEYDGSHYHGWQIQKDPVVPTVQLKLEEALSSIANEPVRVHCAGRTDNGVHGIGQVVHFDTFAQRKLRSWIFGTNTKLPPDIAVRWAKPVSEDFHARFSAYRRRYQYVIYNAPVRPAILSGKVSWDPRPMDADAMNEAAQALVGSHDFSAYRAVACQSKSAIRDVYLINVYRNGQHVVMDIEANAFLMHMVRNIAGVLMTIGCGEAKVPWAKEVLLTRDRTQGGVTAPPEGLYFLGALYPEEFQLGGWQEPVLL